MSHAGPRPLSLAAPKKASTLFVQQHVVGIRGRSRLLDELAPRVLGVADGDRRQVRTLSHPQLVDEVGDRIGLGAAADDLRLQGVRLDRLIDRVAGSFAPHGGSSLAGQRERNPFR
jgi:hypothetical protein